MATTTPNLNLTKPAYTDKADIKQINDNMDKIDGAYPQLMKAYKGTDGLLHIKYTIDE